MDPVTPNEITARNIATYRRWRGISQEELADRLIRLGHTSSRRSVSRLEAGEKQIDIDQVYAVALALETTVDKLITPIDRQREADFGAIQYEPISLGPDIEEVPPQTAHLVLTDGNDDLQHVPDTRVTWDDDGYAEWRIPVENIHEMLRASLLDNLAQIFEVHLDPDTPIDEVRATWDEQTRRL